MQVAHSIAFLELLEDVCFLIVTHSAPSSRWFIQRASRGFFLRVLPLNVDGSGVGSYKVATTPRNWAPKRIREVIMLLLKERGDELCHLLELENCFSSPTEIRGGNYFSVVLFTATIQR